MNEELKKFENTANTAPSAEPIKVEWEQTGAKDKIPRVLLRCGESHYSATLVDEVFYAELLRVLPEESRKRGTGTRLLQKLVEVARARGVKTIIHHAISTKGLRIIRDKLPMAERAYYDSHEDRCIPFEEAYGILLENERGENQNKDTAIYTFTEIDQLISTGT